MGSAYEDAKRVAGTALYIVLGVVIVSAIGLPLALVALPETFLVPGDLFADGLAGGSLSLFGFVAAVAVVNAEAALILAVARPDVFLGRRPADESGAGLAQSLRLLPLPGLLYDLAIVNYWAGVTAILVCLLADTLLFHVAGFVLAAAVRYLINPLIVLLWLGLGRWWWRAGAYELVAVHYAGVPLAVGGLGGAFVLAIVLLGPAR